VGFYFNPSWEMIIMANDLPRATPESQGITSQAILQFVEAAESQIHELHSFMLLRHGQVIAEGWWSPYGREHRHSLFSLSKSFTSTAVGLAVAEGYFTIDDSVVSFFPDQTPGEISEPLAAMRVRHLLSMTTGHAVDTWTPMNERPDGDWITGFFDVPVLHEPGTHFLYNTGATYMLSAIVQNTTGMKLVDYLKPRLFEPLGIVNATWEESPEGINMGGIGLSLTTEDVARFGQLYLQKGLWEGHRIVPEAWVEAATSIQGSNGESADGDWMQGYGYQFWGCRHGAYRGDGVFGQYCIVMPEQDAVLAITGGVDLFDMQEPLNLVWDMLLPVMQPEALPDDAASQEKLAGKLSSLKCNPVQGQAASAVSSRIYGYTYRLDANELNLESLSLNLTDAGWTVGIQKGAAAEQIACGYIDWRAGVTTLFNQPGETAPAPIATSGAWTTDDTFTMCVRLDETPFYYTLVYYFAEDQLMIEAQVNVSFEAPRTLLLTAQSA
jgi:CubicO group peptidase (beta-lactamase class C family)